MAHVHEPPSHGLRRSQRRSVWGALACNAAFVVGELVGATVFHSLALLGDAAHQATDVVALGLALGALGLAERPASARLTFGFQRAEVLAAMANGGLLGGAAVWVAYAALRRLAGHAHGIHPAGVLAVAAAGLAANAAGAALLARARGRSLTMFSSALHLASDAAALLGTMVASAVILVTGWQPADSVAALAIAALALYGSWRLLLATVHVLLEGTPSGLDPAEVEAVLRAGPDVTGVHHLHLWSLASDVPALSAHVVVGHEITLHDAQLRVEELKASLHDRFGIEHATVELECHECAAPDDTAGAALRARSG